MLQKYVLASHDRSRMRRLRSREAFVQVWEFCLAIEMDPNIRWIGRLMRGAPFFFPIRDATLRKLGRTYQARPPSLQILRRVFQARGTHLSRAIGKGSPIGSTSLVPSTKLARDPARSQVASSPPSLAPAPGTPEHGRIDSSRAMQMLLTLEPRLNGA
jgi:hypothetical protein